MTAAGYGQENEFAKFWPADLHVIGKDILAPPHAVYWPIMLKASNLSLPKQILAHGWWTSSGAKMSKSTGETVDPLQLVDQYGADAFRYFVMREMTGEGMRSFHWGGSNRGIGLIWEMILATY